ncbi:heavy-metal-associated domain-containing protein [Flavobacterium weaverense]|uniref:Heavy-metal-associated domain-containing protein n=1 Tax=Flavobacterium weaverense TaxID=271156 RepID=A0A3M0A6F0_9FLAO|nr:heavy-metal-associated domain-containing protein [Flavobacterium weaverense]RMA78378.1 hypothetical protein BC961_0762 [Flavobacterium weaverense]
MNIIEDNVIPGVEGRTFGTNAVEDKDLLAIKAAIQEINGIKDITVDHVIFPREFTVFTINVIAISEIQKKVKQAGFHAIPKQELDV